jgi:hypothetical protein
MVQGCESFNLFVTTPRGGERLFQNPPGETPMCAAGKPPSRSDDGADAHRRLTRQKHSSQPQPWIALTLGGDYV